MSGVRLWASRLTYSPGTVVGDSEIVGIAKQAYKYMVEDYNARKDAASEDKKRFWPEDDYPGAMNAFAVGDNTKGLEIYVVSSIKGLKKGLRSYTRETRKILCRQSSTPAKKLVVTSMKDTPIAQKFWRYICTLNVIRMVKSPTSRKQE